MSQFTPEELNDLAAELDKAFSESKIYTDVYPQYNDDDTASCLQYEIDGDWKHEHIRSKILMNHFFNERGIKIDCYEEDYPSDSDDYKSLYTVYLYKPSDDSVIESDTAKGYGANLVTM